MPTRTLPRSWRRRTAGEEGPGKHLPPHKRQNKGPNSPRGTDARSAAWLLTAAEASAVIVPHRRCDFHCLAQMFARQAGAAAPPPRDHRQALRRQRQGAALPGGPCAIHMRALFGRGRAAAFRALRGQALRRQGQKAGRGTIHSERRPRSCAGAFYHALLSLAAAGRQPSETAYRAISSPTSLENSAGSSTGSPSRMQDCA